MSHFLGISDDPLADFRRHYAQTEAKQRAAEIAECEQCGQMIYKNSMIDTEGDMAVYVPGDGIHLHLRCVERYARENWIDKEADDED